MQERSFRAVEAVRRIRNAHHAQLKDATSEERIHFYEEKARRLHEELGLPPIRPESPSRSPES
jgi:hypothetical protein